jgi:hypothetical protein
METPVSADGDAAGDVAATGSGPPALIGGKVPRHRDAAGSTRRGPRPINENTPPGCNQSGVNSIPIGYHNTVWQGADMKKVSQEAGHRPAVAPRNRGPKAPGGAKGPGTETVRSQLHLGGQTAKRLAVHAALVGRNASRVADDILSSWLTRYGQGRAIFEAEDQPRDPAGDANDDRLIAGTLVTNSDDSEAA